jgi:ATP-dependent DNA ligase
VLASKTFVGKGVGLFDAVCAADLEGVVAKRLNAPYRIVEPLTWRKIKNPNY